MGLVGMGDIAYELAKLLRAFGCEVLVHSPSSPDTRWTVEDTDTRFLSLTPACLASDLYSKNVMSSPPLSPQREYEIYDWPRRVGVDEIYRGCDQYCQRWNHR